MEELIVISKTKIEERIKELEKSKEVSEGLRDEMRAGIEHFEIKALKDILSQSTSAEEVFNAGRLGHDSEYGRDFEWDNYEDYIKTWVK